MAAVCQSPSQPRPGGRRGAVAVELRQLEQEMVRVQSEEIQQMAQWYRSWYPAGAQR
jgi:uncharacterized protein (DUF305 family)